MSNQNDRDQVIAGHSYDGIEELDNPLPKWWLYGFYLTIVFAVLYTGYYQFGPGISLSEAYTRSVAAIKASRADQQKGGVDTAALLAAVADKGQAAQGKAMFLEKCAACHGENGQGIIGPNLTDKFWIHGGKPEQIFTTIKTGVPDKGMPVWGETLKPDEMMRLVSFIASIKDSHPVGAKEPQGQPEE